MSTYKTFLAIIAILMVVSNANAELILTINDLDVTELSVISGTKDLIIAVTGENEAKAQNISVTADSGNLEILTEPNMSVEEPASLKYLFNFTDEAGADTIRLAAGSELIYQLVLLSVLEENKTIAFGIDSETLAASQSQAQQENSNLDVVEEILSEPNEIGLHSESSEPQEPNIPDSLFKPRNEPQPMLVHCPYDSIKPYCLEEFDYFPMIIEENFGASGFTTLDGFGYVELQEITSSQFLDPNVTYYVPDPPLLIHGVGEGIDVIIPSGTTIILAEDWDYGIVVYDGANVYFGEPEPEANEPNSIYGPGDTNNPVPPVWIVGESGSSFFNNICGIFIDRTAGTRCKLDNICLRGFYYGLEVDQQLDYPISNIHAFGCYNGILSFGPNRILNSSVSYYGIWSPEWQYYGLAYCFLPESWDGNIIFEGADFEIYNCLADDGDDGFTVYGLYEPNEPPNFYLRDCVATNCYSGFNGWNGIIAFSIICPGLYNNYQNKNFSEMPFTDPVYEVNDPLVVDSNDYRIFLNPDSNFVDHGSGLSPYPGWTTRIDGIPDEGVGDIWPHYQSKQVELLTADLNSDHIVDMNDLAEFVGQWLVPGPNSADLNNDQIVNFLDFSVLANQWQNTEMYIELIDLAQYTNIEPNNVSGYVGIYLKNIPLSAQTVSVYMDNTPIDNWIRDWTTYELIGFESYFFSNGWHTIRLVCTDLYGNVTNYEPINVRFNNLLYNVMDDGYFYHGEDKVIGGFYDGNSVIEANLTNIDDQVIWSDTYAPDEYVSINVPWIAFGDEQLCTLRITEAGSDTESEIDWKKKFDKSLWASGAKMVIVIPNENISETRGAAISACIQACKDRNVSWVSLYGYDVNKENLTHLYTKSLVKYIYWVGHGASQVESVERTNIECWGNKGWPWGWIPYFGYRNIRTFSWTRQSRDAEPLPEDYDEVGFDLWKLGMHESWNKKIVFIDCCSSANLRIFYNGIDMRNDMAAAYGMFSLQGQGSKDQIYIGWREETKSGYLKDYMTQGIKLFWERMGIDGTSLREALQYTCDHPVSEEMLISFWGTNFQTNFFDYGGDDNLFVQGNGEPYFSGTELEP